MFNWHWQWWRFKSFWQPFWRFLLWGDSTWAKVVKLVGLGLSILGPFAASFWEHPSYIYVYAFDREVISTPFKFGTLIAIFVMIFWIVVSAARAYEQAGRPELIVGENLVWDNMRYRLSITSRGKPCETSVRLLKVVAADGREIIPSARLNVDMEQTHYTGRGDIKIRKNQTESVSIATIRDEGRHHKLLFTGATYNEDMLVLDRVYFQLEIANEPKPIERWFCFHSSDAVFPVTNEAPPMLQQANV